MGKENVIVDEIGYDKDGHTVYTKLGNGTETTYSYDKQRERLESMCLKADGSSIMENKYSYDAVDNILSIDNTAGGGSDLGGTSSHSYQYDMLNRLTHASGSAKDVKYDMSMSFGRMSEPLSKVQEIDVTSPAKSYSLAYKYEDANVTQYDAYLPYGELLVDEHSSSTEMPYKFNGKEFDSETGLYYYGARYMNPITSLWYGVDPLAEKYPNVGAFVYCVGNPVKLIDPDGKIAVISKEGQTTVYTIKVVVCGEKLKRIPEGAAQNKIDKINKKNRDITDRNNALKMEFESNLKKNVENITMDDEGNQVRFDIHVDIVGVDDPCNVSTEEGKKIQRILVRKHTNMVKKLLLQLL